jgi:hypothetical protein
VIFPAGTLGGACGGYAFYGSVFPGKPHGQDPVSHNGYGHHSAADVISVIYLRGRMRRRRWRDVRT